MTDAEGFDLEFVAAHAAPTAELLAFYRRKAEGFESERLDLLRRLADAEAMSAELHRLRWEARAREDEIRELQGALSDARLFLLDEREQALKLAAENDGLKAQEVEDRRRIAHLLALTEPITHEFTFFRDSRPAGTASLPAPAAAASGVRGPVGRGGFGVAQPPPPAMDTVPTSVRLADGGRAIRTIVLPTSTSTGASAGTGAFDRGDALAMQCESLRRQLADVQRLADERAQAYARDRDALRDQHERKTGADASSLRQLEATLETTQNKLGALTRDYLVQRSSFSSNERLLREQAAQSRAAREHAERELALEKAQGEAQLGALASQLEAVTRAQRSQGASRAEQHNDAVRLLRAQWAADKEALSAQAAALKAELKQQKAKYSRLDRRRAGEAEGFMRDVSALRKALRQLEMQWAVLGGAVSDAAMAQEVRDMEAHAADIAARLGAVGGGIGEGLEGEGEGEGEGAVDDEGPTASARLSVHQRSASTGQGRDWLPSRSANVPSVVSGIRPGGAAVRAPPRRSGAGTSSGGRKTLTGFVPLDFFAREAAEAADPAARRRLAQRGALLREQPVMYRAVRSSGYGAPSQSNAPPGAASPQPQQQQQQQQPGRLATLPFASPGVAVPMDIDSLSPPPSSLLRRAAHVAAEATAHLREREGEERWQREGGDETAESTLASAAPSPVRRMTGLGTGGGPRRVLASAPDAAPRFDAATSTAGFDESDVIEHVADTEAEDEATFASPGHLAAEGGVQRTRQIRSQLEMIRDRIVQLDTRAARLQSQQSP